MKPLCVVLALVTGCSFVFTRGPSTRPRAHAECTSSLTWPVVDGVFSGLFLLAMVSAITEDEDRAMSTDDDEATKGQKIATAAIFTAATGLGALVGYGRVTRCREARETFPQQHPDPYGAPPYAAPQPHPGQPPQPYPGTEPAPAPTPAPPSSGLGTEGDVCAERAECATGLTCTNNVCIRPPAPR